MRRSRCTPRPAAIRLPRSPASAAASWRQSRARSWRRGTTVCPVLLDGFACTAAAAVIAKMCEGGLDHAQVAHRSAEPGHQRLLEALSLRPLLDLDLRLGEASGAALAASLARMAVAAHNGMATFDSAGVSGPAD